MLFNRESFRYHDSLDLMLIDTLYLRRFVGRVSSDLKNLNVFLLEKLTKNVIFKFQLLAKQVMLFLYSRRWLECDKGHAKCHFKFGRSR